MRFRRFNLKVVALIALLGLYQREKDGSQQEDPAHELTMPEEHKASGTNHHQRAASHEQDAERFTDWFDRVVHYLVVSCRYLFAAHPC